MAKVKLGASVVYRDGSGFEKAALVVGTRKSVQEGTGVDRPEKGSVNLQVFSPSGKSYFRSNVAEGDGPKTFSTI